MADKEVVLTDRLVATFIKIRNARAAHTEAYNAKDEEFKASLKMIEVELLRRAMAQKVDGFTVKGIGTTYISEEMHLSIGDDRTFDEFVLESGDLGFFERRVTLKHVKEYMAEHNGELPPGLYAFRENRMRVRKTTKGTKGK